jgi:hypothetical protein
MSQYPVSTLPDSARMELTVTATSTQSANQPKFLIVLAIILLAGAMIYAITGLTARVSASARVQSAGDKARRVLALVEEVKLNATGPQETRYNPDPRLASKLEELAAGMSLKINGNISSGEGAAAAPFPGIQLKQYKALAVNQDPAVMLSWLAATQNKDEYPGLDIYTLFLRPGATAGGGPSTPPQPGAGPATDDAIYDGGWNLDVTFQRWERKGA